MEDNWDNEEEKVGTVHLDVIKIAWTIFNMLYRQLNAARDYAEAESIKNKPRLSNTKANLVIRTSKFKNAMAMMYYELGHAVVLGIWDP